MNYSYRQYRNFDGSVCACGILRSSDNASIPFAPANIDYQQFKTDVLDGAELQDPDGQAMTPAEATAFIEGLP